MSAESEFLDRWRQEEPIYAAWGRFVARRLSETVRELVAPTRLELFLKIPVASRVKEQDSLLQKAFYRGKGYENPYDDIEDKVGLRFVVLLTEDIRTIERAVQEADEWTATMARDFELERDQNPYEFDYQSLHYVVRSRSPVEFDGVMIPVDVPCEVQIRTLLQHAYSELTHDTIYKPNVKATPKLKRAAAKSMALIEATSDYFSSVHKVIQTTLADVRRLNEFLLSKYQSEIGRAASDSALNSLVVDHYLRFIGTTFEADFESWWPKKLYIAENIKTRADTAAIYRTPGILLVYFCVSKAPTASIVNSPLSDRELEPIYSDLGLAVPAGVT